MISSNNKNLSLNTSRDVLTWLSNLTLRVKIALKNYIIIILLKKLSKIKKYGDH